MSEVALANQLSNKTCIISVSGGKDSTATLLYAIEKKLDFQAVFMDTGWEAPETYLYLDYLESKLGIAITRVKPKLSFVELAVKKKRFPSPKARFCTQHLKVMPFIDWLLCNTSGEVWIHQGIRADESIARSKANMCDDYFKLEKGSYAIPRVKEWLKLNSAIAFRPILDWTVDMVFDIHKRNGIEPNPLYKQGFTRVGCMPCIMCRHSEMKLIVEKRPDDLAKIKQAEQQVGRSFFAPNFIAGKKIAMIDDVVNYIANPNQTKLFEGDQPSCQSIYNICE